MTSITKPNGNGNTPLPAEFVAPQPEVPLLQQATATERVSNKTIPTKANSMPASSASTVTFLQHSSSTDSKPQRLWNDYAWDPTELVAQPDKRMLDKCRLITVPHE